MSCGTCSAVSAEMDGKDGKARDHIAGLVRALVAGRLSGITNCINWKPPYARAGGGSIHQKRVVFYFLFYFRLFSGRPSMPNEKREKRSIYL